MSFGTTRVVNQFVYIVRVHRGTSCKSTKLNLAVRWFKLNQSAKFGKRLHTSNSIALPSYIYYTRTFQSFDSYTTLILAWSQSN